MSIAHKDIANIREEYMLGELNESIILDDPIHQFQRWFSEAIKSDVNEPNAMNLATVDANGKPSSRIVLLKDINEQGFSFFTNYNSRKGEEMSLNSSVALLFFWPELQRQVRIEGIIEKLPAEDSDEYFQLRPKRSQLGAIASPQSQTIPNRDFLEERMAHLEVKYLQADYVPRPENWGGYLVKPVRFEFWQGRRSRLHDRIAYTTYLDKWVTSRLAP